MILKMMLIVFGIFLLILDLFMYARQKLTDGIGVAGRLFLRHFLYLLQVSTVQPYTCGMEQKCGTVCICCVCCYNPVFI